MQMLFPYFGAAILMIWGIAHIVIPTRSIVEGFGPISADNRRILLMEWLMEGVLLIFIGVIVALVSFLSPEPRQLAIAIYRACALVLVVMAGVSGFTGARTAAIPMKLCPYIFLIAAALIYVPTIL